MSDTSWTGILHGNAGGGKGRRSRPDACITIRLALAEGAALVLDNSKRGSGGTVMVSPAMVVPPPRQNASPWLGASEPYIVPPMTMASEDYNRIVRMIQRGITPTMSVEIQAQYHDDDLMGYNTVAEIPGTDPLLKDEIVMLGGHLDSWHGATGATDNAAGSTLARAR